MGPVGKEEEVLVHSKGLNTRTNTDIPQRAYRKAFEKWVNKCEKAHCWEMVVSQQCYFCERQPCFSFHKREAKIESTLLRMDTFHYFVVSLPQGGFFISRHRPDNKSQHLNYLWHQHWGWAFFPQHSSTLHKKKGNMRIGACTEHIARGQTLVAVASLSPPCCWLSKLETCL